MKSFQHKGPNLNVLSHALRQLCMVNESVMPIAHNQQNISSLRQNNQFWKTAEEAGIWDSSRGPPALTQLET